MADDLKGLAQLTKCDDDLSLKSGGDGGGAVEKVILRRSELEVLRRMADRYPINDNERMETVACVMDVIRTSKSRRTRISAVKALTSLDKVNLEEIKTVLLAKKLFAGEQASGTSPVTINFNVVEQVVVKADETPKETAPAHLPSVIEHVIESANGRNGH